MALPIPLAPAATDKLLDSGAINPPVANFVLVLEANSEHTIVVPDDHPATAIPLTVTFPTEVTIENTMYRIRHVCDNITNGIGLQSYATTGNFPAVASIQLTGNFH